MAHSLDGHHAAADVQCSDEGLVRGAEKNKLTVDRLLNGNALEGHVRSTLTALPIGAVEMKRGKKRRSKAKKIASQQRKESGMEDPNKHRCLFCECFIQNSEASVNDHYTRKAHLRLEKLYLYTPFFEDHGLSPTAFKKGYNCKECGQKGIPADAKKLKAHLLNVHIVSSKKKYPDTLTNLKAWYSGCEDPVVKYRVHKTRPKVYWVKEFNLEEESQGFEKVTAPALCMNSGGCGFHFLLVNGRFSCSMLTVMTELGTFLEAEGNATKRGEMKRADYDARIVTFGLRYAYGKIGRFRHNVQSCYYRAHQLANLLCDHLKVQFRDVFKHLEDVLEGEGIEDEDNIRLGNTPFTTMCITRNYHCNIHKDTDDVSYGFFIWFGNHRTKDQNGNEVKFYLPGVKLFAIPLVGDVMLCKSKELWHCTKTIGDRGQLGVALYQKSSFFRWYATLKGQMLGNVLDKLVTSWCNSCDIEY